MEQMNSQQVVSESYSEANGSVNAGYVSRSVGYGPSSYQALYGYRSKGRAGSGKLSRYGYGVEGTITAVSVNESFAQFPGILSARSDEKQELSVLNDRFATYIDKVRRLESQNKALSTRITELESSKTVVTSRAGEMYDDELCRLRREIEHLTHDKAAIEIQLHNCCQDLTSAEKRIKIEIEAKLEAEKLVKSLRKDVDDATLARVDLERKLETLREEFELLKAASNEDIESLRTQVTVKHEEVFDAPCVGPTADLTESLREIRVAYEQLTRENKTDLEVVYKNSVADLQVQLKISNQSLSETKATLMDTRRQLQTITVEIEGLRSTNTSLEAQISDLQDLHCKDSEEYQLRIDQLESELQTARDNMARHLADYNRLMNLKLSLDLEIATYRKLLEGEEGRISQSAANMELSYNSVDKSVTMQSVSVTSTTSAGAVGSPQIRVKEEVVTRSRSSTSSSSSDSGSD